MVLYERPNQNAGMLALNPFNSMLGAWSNTLADTALVPVTGVVNHEGLTVIFGICANGDVVPPFFIFKASKLMMQSSLWKDQFGPEAPQDAAYHCNNTAYNNFDMMMKWIDHLNKHGKPGRKLLVMVSCATTPSFFFRR
jgi:hypothetical protein